MPPGLAVELAPHDPVTSGVLYCGLPDWEEMNFVLDYLRPGDVMVDVGANVGLYSLLAASVGGVRVTAFEPDDGARRRAAANIGRNGFVPTVELRPEAVGAAPARSSFSVGLGPENRLVRDGPGGPSSTRLRTVDIVALDDVVDGPVALVKIDVEGEELAVLDGAERLLRRSHPVVIVEANAPDALSERLASLGYRWVTYDTRSRRLVESSALPAIGTNGIAVADLAAAAHRLSTT